MDIELIRLYVNLYIYIYNNRINESSEGVTGKALQRIGVQVVD